jgi:hypothetical protein
MDSFDKLQIPTPDASGNFAALALKPATPAASGPTPAEISLRDAEARHEAMTEKLDALNEILAKPLSEILAERDRFKEASAAWDAFGAQWMLSQRAMKRVALDLGAAQGVGEEEIVRRALVLANEVLNGDGVDLGGTIAEAQLAHIARHRPFLRRQFR